MLSNNTANLKNGRLDNKKSDAYNNKNNTHEFIKKDKNPELEAKFAKAKMRNNRKKEIEKTSVTTVPGIFIV